MRYALAVDDSTRYRLIFRRYLEALGFEVEEAGNGLAALVLCREPRDFDVILLDHEMPEMDGVTFLERFQQLSKAPGIPVILCTGIETPDIAGRALQAGARRCLVKPFTLDDLRRTLTEIGVLS